MQLLWHIEANNLRHANQLIATAADHQPIGRQAPIAAIDGEGQLVGAYYMSTLGDWLRFCIFPHIKLCDQCENITNSE